MILLAPAFFITAILYAIVGFGGGSTYNALLALAGTDYHLMPTIALLCNLIVVTGGTFRFARAGHLYLRRIAPWLFTSIPAAWLGGYIHVPERVFIGLLGLSLLIAGMQILGKVGRQNDRNDILPAHDLPTPKIIPFIVGGALGFLAGMVGIGGGIFLAPVLYLLRWDYPRAIAATCSFFILVNSLAGITGQIMKLTDLNMLVNIQAYWLLFPAVLIGGQIGSHMGAKRLNPRILRGLTGCLILYVAIRLLWRWWGMG